MMTSLSLCPPPPQLLACGLLAVGIWLKVDDGAQHHVTQLVSLENQEYQIDYRYISTLEAIVVCIPHVGKLFCKITYM